jgi:hypothetical protein
LYERKKSKKILPLGAAGFAYAFEKDSKPMKNKRAGKGCFIYRPDRKARLVNRRLLFEHLIDEIKYGSSISGLYTGMLMKTLLAEEPELRREYPQFASEPSSQASEPRRKRYEPSEAGEAREARPKRLGPSIPRQRLTNPRR